MAIKTIDIAWLAAMLEGEGSFYTYTKKNLRRPLTYPELSFQSVDYDIVVRVASLLKSNISRVVPYNTSKQKSYKVRACSTKAVQWMMTIYPLMGIRRKTKIREILDTWRLSIDGRKLRYQ